MRIASPIVALAIAAVVSTTMAEAADETREYGPFTVDRAVLAGLAGSLDVRVVPGTEALLRATGPAAALAELTVDAAAGKLEVTAPQAGHSVTVVDRVTVVTGAGASSNVVIGGSSSSSGGAAAAPLDLVLDLPKGTRLELHGFTGEAMIGDLEGSALLQAIGGSIRAGALGAAELAAIGEGSIEAASVTGDLAANVTGGGRIVVKDGEIGAATIAVTGAGQVEIDAPAASAEVNLVGDGQVRMLEVAGATEVNRVGGGRFTTGPR